MISRRGIFGLLAAAGVGGFLKPPPAAAAGEFPQEGFELTKLRWFNRVRGFGYGTGLSSGHQIRIEKKVFEEADIEKVELTTRYWVYWKRDGDRVVAQKISDSVPLTREELWKASNWQEWTDLSGDRRD